MYFVIELGYRMFLGAIILSITYMLSHIAKTICNLKLMIVFE